MDIWMERTQENYQKIKTAFHQFGMPVFDMTEKNFLEHPVWDVFTFGVPPSAINVMVSVKGLSFEECFREAVHFKDEELVIRTIQLRHLLEAKKSSGRYKDLDDIENLGL